MAYAAIGVSDVSGPGFARKVVSGKSESIVAADAFFRLISAAPSPSDQCSNPECETSGPVSF